MTRYGITEWHDCGIDYLAIFVPWCQVAEILGHEYDGDQEDLERVKAAILRAGAPKWIERAKYDGICEKGICLIGGPIVYAEALNRAHHLWELEDRFGIVEYEDTTWYLTQVPYIAGTNERPCYEAIAIDINGDTALIKWTAADNWREIEDESDVCNWNKPVSVTVL